MLTQARDVDVSAWPPRIDGSLEDGIDLPMASILFRGNACPGGGAGSVRLPGVHRACAFEFLQKTLVGLFELRPLSRHFALTFDRRQGTLRGGVVDVLRSPDIHGPPRRRDRFGPVSVALRFACIPQRARHASSGVRLAIVLASLPREVPAAAAEDDDQGDCGEREGAPPARSLPGRARLRGDRVDLRTQRPFLGSREMRADPVGHLARVRRSIAHDGLKALADDRPESVGGVRGGEAFQRRLQQALRRRDELVLLLAFIGRAAGEDLAQDRPEREHVAALVEIVDVAHRLLRRHVRGCSHDGSGDRGGPLGFASNGRDHRLVRPRLDLALAEDLREPPVDDLHLAERADHHVRRLEIAVDHAARVGVSDRLRHLLEHGEEVDAMRVGIESLRERPSLDQLHREARTPVRLKTEAVDRHDAGVLELAADLRFFDEPLDHVLAVEELRTQDLERNVAIEIPVAALVDDADAAPRDFPENLESRVLPGVLVGVAAQQDRGRLLAGIPQEHVRSGAVNAPDRFQDRLVRPPESLEETSFPIAFVLAHLVPLPSLPEEAFSRALSTKKSPGVGRTPSRSSGARRLGGRGRRRRALA